MTVDAVEGAESRADSTVAHSGQGSQTTQEPDLSHGAQVLWIWQVMGSCKLLLPPRVLTSSSSPNKHRLLGVVLSKHIKNSLIVKPKDSWNH